MACKKHNYKGKKDCAICAEENGSPWLAIAAVLFILILIF